MPYSPALNCIALQCKTESRTPSTDTTESEEATRSGPPTPKSLRERLANRFRWRRRLSTVRPPADSDEAQHLLQSPTRNPEARLRRRLARESEKHGSFCGGSGSGSSISSGPVAGEVANGLALAGVMIATEELDRLSDQARRSESPHSLLDEHPTVQL